jgi:hypothetical protein
MITKKQKKLWLAALRSGKYKQGFGDFRGDGINTYIPVNTYCALGLLQRVCKKGKDHYPESGVDIEEFTTIVYMNDNEFKSFKQIANWIEKNIEAR